MTGRVAAYYWLAKPGIVYGNLVAAFGGFFLAAQGGIDLVVFGGMIVGLSFVMASACVFNNYLDRDLDRHMSRTNTRALVTGAIPGKHALIYGAVLGGIGFLTLLTLTNPTAAFMALVGFVFYVVIYGFAKRHTSLSTLIGSVAGAMPPVVGYTAVSQRVDMAAWLLFFCLVFWQMPHFFAIAIRRVDDYAAANLPVLPRVRGNLATKQQILWYIGGFMVATSLLTTFGYTGVIFMIAMVLGSIGWLRVALRGFGAKDDKRWARSLFFYSLGMLIAFSVLVAFGRSLP